jgi:hypothetical protein
MAIVKVKSFNFGTGPFFQKTLARGEAVVESWCCLIFRCERNSSNFIGAGGGYGQPVRRFEAD